MTQTITITKTEKGIKFEVSKNLSAFEALGLLRYYEKDIWLKLQQNVSKSKIPDKKK